MWPVVARPTQTWKSNKIQKRLGKPATSIVGFLMGLRTLTLVPKLMTIKAPLKLQPDGIYLVKAKPTNLTYYHGANFLFYVTGRP